MPGPNNYTIKRDFDPKPTKGPSIGVGREVFNYSFHIFNR